jgi:serine/threonine protein kinase
MKGGNLIGKGGFGNVYDNINDIFTDPELDIQKREITPDMINMYTKESIKSNKSSSSINSITSSKQKLINNSMVFKYIFESDKISEEDNNDLVWNIVKPSLTSLHRYVKSINIPKINTILVFSKFDCNLEEFLYEKKGSGEKHIWKKKPFNSIDSYHFISKVMFQLLNFCKCIHKHKFVHYDIKLDNVLVNKNENNIVLADYGLLQSIDDIKEFQDDPDEHFMGMINYMPPFCQYNGNKHDVTIDYTSRMNALFNSYNNKTSRHPQIWIPENEQGTFFKQIAESYKIKGLIDQSNKFKIDLHPIGIILLQLLFYFRDENVKDQENDFMIWYGIAKELLMNNKETAVSILTKIGKSTSHSTSKTNKTQRSSNKTETSTNKTQLGGGEKKKVFCAGRLRVVYYKDKKQFVNISGKMMSLKEAKLTHCK